MNEQHENEGRIPNDEFEAPAITFDSSNDRTDAGGASETQDTGTTAEPGDQAAGQGEVEVAPIDQPVREHLGENPHVRLTHEWTQTRDGKEPKGIELTLPPMGSKVIQDAFARFPNESVNDDWRASLEQAVSTSCHSVRENGKTHDLYHDSFLRDDSEWTQGVDVGGKRLTSARPAISPNSETILTGRAAIQSIRAQIGLGTFMQVPLWNSGFWVTIKAPSDAAVIDLERQILEEKISLGRFTNGASLTNYSVFIAKALVDFVITHIHDTTLRDRDDLLKHIKIHDLHLLAAGMASVMYPNGFEYRRPIIGVKASDQRIVSGKMNISKSVWTDWRGMNQTQINHMCRRQSGVHTADQIRDYQNGFKFSAGRRVEIFDNLAINLRVPDLEEYLTSGNRWVNDIVQMVDQAFGIDQDPRQRNNFISLHGRAAAMCQNMHWIESIEVGKALIENREDIRNALAEMSESEEVRGNYFEAVNRFMDDSTISVVAVATVDDAEDNRLPRFPHLVPIDAVSAFFTLTGQKVAVISNR